MAQRIPNFLYVGASKAGSTWIFECLREHPDVFVPEAKDIKFFDRKFDKGLDWYLSFFSKAVGEKAVGELSHDYFFFPRVAKQIHDVFPDVKILACLREPVDKMISNYKYARTIYLDPKVSFRDFLFSNEAVGTTGINQIHNLGKESAAYVRNLAPYYDVFPRDKIKVVFYDDLKARPLEFIRGIYRFLGVDDAFVPSVLHEKVNASRDSRFGPLGHLMYSAAGLMRLLGWENLVGRIKHNRAFGKFFYKMEVKVEVSPEARLEARRYFSRDYDRLEALTGLSLPPSWRNFS